MMVFAFRPLYPRLKWPSTARGSFTLIVQTQNTAFNGLVFGANAPKRPPDSYFFDAVFNFTNANIGAQAQSQLSLHPRPFGAGLLTIIAALEPAVIICRLANSGASHEREAAQRRRKVCQRVRECFRKAGAAGLKLHSSRSIFFDRFASSNWLHHYRRIILADCVYSAWTVFQATRCANYYRVFARPASGKSNVLGLVYQCWLYGHFCIPHCVFCFWWLWQIPSVVTLPSSPYRQCRQRLVQLNCLFRRYAHTHPKTRGWMTSRLCARLWRHSCPAERRFPWHNLDGQPSATMLSTTRFQSLSSSSRRA